MRIFLDPPFDCKNDCAWTAVGCTFASDIRYAEPDGYSCVLPSGSEKPIG